MSRQRVVSILIPIILVAVAAVTRLTMLEHPDRIIFDETYYVDDANAYLEQSSEEGFAVHPPVGKWAIAAGIAWFGDNAFGWRIMGAIAGIAQVLLTYLIGVRLLRKRGAAALAGLLALVDGLLFVQSRTSMLDIFLGCFVALGAWLLLVDRDRSRLEEDPGEARALQPSVRDAVVEPLEVDPLAAEVVAPAPIVPLPRRGHGVRVLAGVAFGLAFATKWSGFLALVVAVAVVIAWELAWRKRVTGHVLSDLGPLVASLAVCFVLVPAAVYAASYVPWFTEFEDTWIANDEDICRDDQDRPLDPCGYNAFSRISVWGRYQHKIWNFHRDLEAEHPYRSPAWKWPFLARPVVYYWENCSQDRLDGVPVTNSEGNEEAPEPCVVALPNAEEIIAMGNPIVWYGALLALIPLVWGMVRRDDRAWFIGLFWLGQYLFWLFESRPVFLFYMTPVVPFMALAIAYAVVWISEGGFQQREDLGDVLHGGAASIALVIAVLAVIVFAWFYPVLSGLELDKELISQRWWFRSWI